MNYEMELPEDVLIGVDTLEDIGDSVREQTGETEKIPVPDLANRIRSLGKGSNIMIIELTEKTLIEETDEQTTYSFAANKTFAEIDAHLRNDGYAVCRHIEIGVISTVDYYPIEGYFSTSQIWFGKDDYLIIFSQYDEEGNKVDTVRLLQRKQDNYDLPPVTESANGKILMVVDGKWEIAQCPVGTQYDMVDVQLTREGWENNENSMYDDTPYIQRVQYDYFNSDEDYPIDVSVKPEFNMMAEAWRCGVFCMRVESQHLVFGASEIPETYLDYHIRITKPYTLSYGLDPTNETLTIYEH